MPASPTGIRGGSVVRSTGWTLLWNAGLVSRQTQVLWATFEVMVAVLVWLDARRLGMQFRGPSGTDNTFGPTLWALGVLLFWVLFLPLYLWRRRRYLPARRQPPTISEVSDSSVRKP